MALWDQCKRGDFDRFFGECVAAPLLLGIGALLTCDSPLVPYLFMLSLVLASIGVPFFTKWGRARPNVFWLWMPLGLLLTAIIGTCWVTLVQSRNLTDPYVLVSKIDEWANAHNFEVSSSPLSIEHRPWAVRKNGGHVDYPILWIHRKNNPGHPTSVEIRQRRKELLIVRSESFDPTLTQAYYKLSKADRQSVFYRLNFELRSQHGHLGIDLMSDPRIQSRGIVRSGLTCWDILSIERGELTEGVFVGSLLEMERIQGVARELFGLLMAEKEHGTR